MARLRATVKFLLDERLVKCSLSANNAVVTCLSTGLIYHIAPCLHAPGKISVSDVPHIPHADRKLLRTHAYALRREEFLLYARMQ